MIPKGLHCLDLPFLTYIPPQQLQNKAVNKLEFIAFNMKKNMTSFHKFDHANVRND